MIPKIRSSQIFQALFSLKNLILNDKHDAKMMGFFWLFLYSKKFHNIKRIPIAKFSIKLESKINTMVVSTLFKNSVECFLKLT